MTLNFEEIRAVWVPSSEWQGHPEGFDLVQRPLNLLLTLGSHNYAE